MMLARIDACVGDTGTEVEQSRQLSVEKRPAPCFPHCKLFFPLSWSALSVTARCPALSRPVG